MLEISLFNLMQLWTDLVVVKVQGLHAELPQDLELCASDFSGQ